MMNIFRITGTSQKKNTRSAAYESFAHRLTCSLMDSRSVPCGLHFHFAAENEVVACEILSKEPSKPLAERLRRAVPEYHSNPKPYTSSSTLLDISVDIDRLWITVRLGAKNGTDIFWTFTTGSLWNTTLKLVFLTSSAYTVYLMLNDYKPTHDPNIDTFKVEYLIGGSLVLAVLFPYRYEFTEVRVRPSIRYLLPGDDYHR